MIIAHTTTVVIAIDTCSFFALTAAAIAIAPETPHTAPPAPSTAPNLLSRPRSLVPTRYIVRNVTIEITVACPNATGPA